jgi:hypothetical protein
MMPERRGSNSSVGRKIRMRILWDFPGREDSDLTLRSGDFVVLLRQQDGDWCFGETEDGRQGYYPRLYAEIQPDEVVEDVDDEKTDIGKGTDVEGKGTSETTTFNDGEAVVNESKGEEGETTSDASDNVITGENASDTTAATVDEATGKDITNYHLIFSPALIFKSRCARCKCMLGLCNQIFTRSSSR